VKRPQQWDLLTGGAPAGLLNSSAAVDDGFVSQQSFVVILCMISLLF
jgi:hypothetical protein